MRLSTEASLLGLLPPTGTWWRTSARQRRRATNLVANPPESLRKRSARAVVDHPHRLALAARDRAGREQLDGHLDAGVLAQGPCDPGAEGLAVELRVDRLAAHRQLVEGVRALQDQLVVRGDALDVQQGVLDLGGVEVDAADDEHLVAAPSDGAHARQ